MHVRILLAKLSQQRHEASTCRWLDGPDAQRASQEEARWHPV